MTLYTPTQFFHLAIALFVQGGLAVMLFTNPPISHHPKVEEKPVEVNVSTPMKFTTGDYEGILAHLPRRDDAS